MWNLGLQRVYSVYHVEIGWGGCQNYGPFSGTPSIKGRIILGDSNRSKGVWEPFKQSE